ncbi:MAG: formate dehydrogenase accessory sulfurtransferase FdhD [Pseudoxanthomonas sp.]|nr:formate dehydrogenase accessory sulfurtransferase FdhD [Pseudoxanthomonas sp.]
MSEPSSTEDAATACAVPGSTRRHVVRRHGATTRALDDAIAEEVPVAFVYNAVPFAVMMATPADFEDFAAGFSLSEGIVDSLADVAVESVTALIEGWELRVRIPEARAAALERRRRSLSGRSGCGLCGSELLEAAMRWPAPVGAGVRISEEALHEALRGLAQGQRLAGATGASHAAAWADARGTIMLVREDIGRHNALDKLIGAMARDGIDPQSGFAVVTSRASYEMAMKAASAGIALLAAVSAPTALAISLAERANLTLVGFARDDGYAVYSHAHRIGGAGAP